MERARAAHGRMPGVFQPGPSIRAASGRAARVVRPRVAGAAVLLAALALACGASPLRAAALSGTLVLTEQGRPVASVENAVIWYVPEGGAPRPAARRAEIQTHERRFMPRVIAVPAGSEVWFPNGDPILHNVFSVSPGNRFDLGLYRQGKGKAARFDSPGLVRVYCNVHQSMVAYVVVCDTPWFTQPESAGAFSLDGLPAGSGTLHGWHEQTGPWSRDVTLPLAEPLEIRLDAQPLRPALHLDKRGRPYPEGGRGDEYR